MGKKKATLAFSVAMVIPKQSERKEDAWKMLSYLAGKKGMKTWTESGIALPTRKSVAEENGFNQDSILNIFMGLSVFAVIHARLGNMETAYELYKRSYEPNKRPPFGALAECAPSNNPYFATGAGGMLQVVLFGFAGLHITEEGIVQRKPCLPHSWRSLTLKGIGIKRKSFEVKSLEFSKS